MTDRFGGIPVADRFGGVPVDDAPQKPRFNGVLSPEELRLKTAAKQEQDLAGNSFLQNAALAYGKSFVDTGEGLQQLYANVADKVSPLPQTMGGLVTGQQPSRSAAMQQQVDDRRNIDAPLMNTGGAILGNVGGQATQLAVPLGDGAKALSFTGRAAPYISNAIKAGAFNAIQPVQQGETRTGNAAAGAVYGAGGEALADVGRFAKAGLISRLEQPARDLAQKATDMGMRLGLGQLSANPLVRTVVSQMERLPFSGATARNEANQQVLNRAVGQEFGANAPKITPDVFAQAKANLSQGFETLAGRNDLKLEPQAVSAMNSLTDEATRLSGAGPIVKGWVNELLSKADAGGVIPGKAYQSIDSRIGVAMKNGGENAKYLGDLRDLIRGEMDKSISAGDHNAWTALRKQWAQLKTVEPLVAKSATGDISAAGLMGRVTANNAGKARMAVGNGGAMGDLAKIGQRFLKDAPNSGTADRLMVNGAVGAGLYGAQHEGYISPEHALEAAAVLGGNRGLLKLLNSRALATGEGRTINGLARLLKTSPQMLPAFGNTAGQGINVVGGTLATPAQELSDAEIVRRFRQQQGR